MKIKGSETKKLMTLLGNVILKNKGGETTSVTTILSTNRSQNGNVVNVNGYLYLTLQLTFDCL
jgi:hypothetical protein